MKGFEPGDTVFVCGPNDDYVGRIVSFPGGGVVELADASWVADSGRLAEFLKAGRAAGMEIEPTGHGVVRFNDLWEWKHPLFKEAV